MERRASRPSAVWGRPALHPQSPPIAIPLAPAYNPCFFDLFSTEGSVKRIKAIYPGSFDPPTTGHLNLIERVSKIFDEFVVAILRNYEKHPPFSGAHRRRLMQAISYDS